jgi:hypothetical protein
MRRPNSIAAHFGGRAAFRSALGMAHARSPGGPSERSRRDRLRIRRPTLAVLAWSDAPITTVTRTEPYLVGHRADHGRAWQVTGGLRQLPSSAPRGRPAKFVSICWAACRIATPRSAGAKSVYGSGARIRTVNLAVNSRLLYR